MFRWNTFLVRTLKNKIHISQNKLEKGIESDAFLTF